MSDCTVNGKYACALMIYSLYHTGLTVKRTCSSQGQQVETTSIHKAVFLDMTADAPARSLWLVMKQFNGFDGCGKCKEPGSTLDIGLAKNNRRKTCHIYPITNNNGCPTPRDHNEVKMQALQALHNQESGMRNVSFS